MPPLGSRHSARPRLQTAPRGLHQPACTPPTFASSSGLHRSGEHGSRLCRETRAPSAHVQSLRHRARSWPVDGAFPQPVQGHELLSLLHRVQYTGASRTCPRHHGRVEPVPSVPLCLLVNKEDPSRRKDWKKIVNEIIFALEYWSWSHAYTRQRGITASGSTGHLHLLVSLHSNPHCISQAMVKLVVVPAMSVWVWLDQYVLQWFFS